MLRAAHERRAGGGTRRNSRARPHRRRWPSASRPKASRAASTRRSRSACSGGCRRRAAASSATTTAAARRRPARWASWSTARARAPRPIPDFNYLQSDNGNLNYKKNQLVSSALKGNHELVLQFHDGWSALGRFSWLYDPATDNTERTPLSDDAKNIAVHNITLLDVWVAKDFELADQPAKVKVGNQVLSWGEDIFIYGGINIINPIDLTRAHKPGVQLKEIFRPAPMVSFNYGASNNLSIEGFWQFRWNAFRFDPVGTPFSTGDVVGNGQQSAFVPSSVLGAPPGTVGDVGTISNGTFIPAGQRFTYSDLLAAGTVVPVLPTQSPPNTNQFGFAARYKPDKSDAEWGFYYLHYNDKIPFIGFVNDPGDHRQSVRARLLPAVRQGAATCSASRSTATSATGRSAPSSSYRPRDGVAIDPTVPLAGPVLRVLRAGHVSGLRRREEMAGAPDDDLSARAERRSGLAAARSRCGRRERCCSRSRPPTTRTSTSRARFRTCCRTTSCRPSCPPAGLRARRRLPARLRIVGQLDAADRHSSTTSAASARTRSRS